jgi:hypothetical protein
MNLIILPQKYCCNMMSKGRNTGGREALYRHAQNKRSTLHKEGQQETRGKKYMVMRSKDPEPRMTVVARTSSNLPDVNQTKGGSCQRGTIEDRSHRSWLHQRESSLLKAIPRQ